MDETSEQIVMVFAFLFAFRAFKYSTLRSGTYTNDGFVIALALAGLIGLYSFGGGPVILLIGLLIVTLLTTLSMTYSSGMVVGALLKRNILGSIPLTVLLVAPLLAFLIEPLISASLFTGIMVLILLYDYRDRYNFARSKYWDDPFLRYVWIWPPFVFIVSVFDQVVIANHLRPVYAAIIPISMIIAGAITGYRNA